VSLLDQLTSGVITVDLAGRICTVNPAAENLLQTSRRISQGQRLSELVPGLEPLGELIERAANEQQTFGIELAIPATHRGGGELELSVKVSPIEVEHNNLLLIELIDSTQRHHLDRESALIDQQGVSRRMLRQLAHEIRNPLGGLRGAAQLLERELNDPELAEFTQVIINESDRLAGLVDTLLGPVGPADMQPANIHEALEHVATIVTSAAPELELVRDYDPSLPDVVMDQGQITQALLNVVQNASQATEGSGRVVIRTRARSNVMLHQEMQRLVLCVEVQDNGPGVAEDIADTLFYPLVTGRAEGTGLGLPLAQDLVTRHGGLIEYDSSPEHTVFTVLLPV
jgi:two-component system nitrogen regulation sensor histidine kinase GlnL